MNIEQKNLDITEVNIYSFINIVRGGFSIDLFDWWIIQTLVTLFFDRKLE